MVSKDLKEIELLKPKPDQINKLAGSICYLIALIFFLIGFAFVISIFGFFAGFGFMLIAMCFVVAGSNLYYGNKKIKCPYCDDELTVSPEKKSEKCKRCHKIILLKWLDYIRDKETKLENKDNNSNILKDKYTHENAEPIDDTKVKRFACWFFGICFLIGVPVNFEENRIMSVFLLIISVILLPNTNKMISERCGFELSGIRRIILIIILFILGSLSLPYDF